MRGALGGGGGGGGGGREKEAKGDGGENYVQYLHSLFSILLFLWVYIYKNK